MKFLIVVDMQNDFVTGSLGTKEAQAIVPNVKARIESGEFDEIVYTKDTHFSRVQSEPSQWDWAYEESLEGQKLPICHCLVDTIGWDIIPELQIKGIIVEKNTFGSLDLLEKLKCLIYEEINEIEVCGLCTDICVVSNALLIRAMFPNVKITVRSDCCAGSTPELHEAALKVMESCQIDIIR